jgi:uncharacterized protein
MATTDKTPSDLTIEPRDFAFGRGGHGARWWLGDDPVATAFYNALSATFPHGERFFMDAVRAHRAEVPDRLNRQITAFLSQEAMHTREHLFFNRQVSDHGYDVAALEARTKTRLDFARSQSPLAQLGATIALEHFTAILAHAALADPRHLAHASDEARAMWRWHAIEEIEHKAVAFDTFLAVTRHLSGRRRWVIRAATMLVSTSLLFSTVKGNMADLFAADGIDRPRTWMRAWLFLWVRPGLLRQVLGEYLSYFLPGFHPWRRDDRALAAAAARDLAAARGVLAPA